ncbi:hypothetical protein [Candidatus Sororendozoicomonas aggregata]|uniref:hypothetical protein n=1 Tax=Candidatus Sororendozoicomonas aggregata TaxID=3073239 RepID=UPI002ECFE3A4
MSRVKQTDPTVLMMAASSSTDQPIRTLSDYAAVYCHSLRNLVKPPAPSQEILSPESLMSEAEKRLLSVEEMDAMQQYISEQTKITIGEDIPYLETLPADTPLFYQFYCMDDQTRIDKRAIRIFNNNCAIDRSRPAIILMHSSLANEGLESQIKKLVQKNENAYSVDMKELLPQLSAFGIKITEGKNQEGNFILRVDPTDCDPDMLDWSCFCTNVREINSLFILMDAIQCMAMFNCDKVCASAGVKTLSDGCIKMDWDVELLEPIGPLQCLNGIRVYVTDWIEREGRHNQLTHCLQPEMGLVAVAWPKHPVMFYSLGFNRKIYTNFRMSVARLFCQNHEISVLFEKEVTVILDNINVLKMLSPNDERNKIAKAIDPDQPLSLWFLNSTSWLQKIAFPLGKVKVDQSRVWNIRSWKKPESASSQPGNQPEKQTRKGCACNIL